MVGVPPDLPANTELVIVNFATGIGAGRRQIMLSTTEGAITILPWETGWH